MALSDKKLFLLDMDGTIYLSEDIFDGTIDFLNYVKRIGGRYAFLTNNSSKGKDAYMQKLRRMGIDAKEDDFLTSADATIRYLHLTYPAETLYYVCGTESLKKQLREAGFRIAETVEEAPTVVLIAYDTELTYRKLEDCCILLMRGAEYVATHPDLVCPTWYGSAPDCGSYIEMLYTATGRRPKVIGKPQPEMVYLALEKYGYRKEEAVIIGDRIYTDVACGVNAGIDSIFVLSGEGVPEDREKFHISPTYMIRNIREVLNLLEKGMEP